MRLAWLGAPLLLALTFPASGRACSDAGAPNHCNPGGSAWIDCTTHAECPTGQVCNEDRHCACECTNGEICASDGCRCAPPERPTAPAGCEVVEDYCFGTLYSVECAPMDAGPRPWCTTDGATPMPCATDSDCERAGDIALVCNARGVCDCPIDPPVSTSSCAAAPGGDTSSWPALAVALLAILWRRTR